jgi:hypothetical protein
MSKEQTTQFIDEVITHAKGEGYDIPDPETKRAQEMFNYYKEKGIL